MVPLLFLDLKIHDLNLDRLGRGIGKIPSGSTASELGLLLRAIEEETVFS
jgi:hypothetical protein